MPDIHNPRHVEQPNISPFASMMPERNPGGKTPRNSAANPHAHFWIVVICLGIRSSREAVSQHSSLYTFRESNSFVHLCKRQRPLPQTALADRFFALVSLLVVGKKAFDYSAAPAKEKRIHFVYPPNAGPNQAHDASLANFLPRPNCRSNRSAATSMTPAT